MSSGNVVEAGVAENGKFVVVCFWVWEDVLSKVLRGVLEE